MLLVAPSNNLVAGWLAGRMDGDGGKDQSGKGNATVVFACMPD